MFDYLEELGTALSEETPTPVYAVPASPEFFALRCDAQRIPDAWPIPVEHPEILICN